MTIEKVELAMLAADVFIHEAKALLRDKDRAKRMELGIGCAQSGVVRHTSMLLTRSLADMRKPGR